LAGCSAAALNAPPSRARAGDLLEQAGRLAEGLRVALRTAGDTTAAATPPPSATTPAEASPPVKQRRTDGGDGALAAGARVGVMAPPGPEYVAAMWSAWLTGSVAVPLALSHPPAELSYVLRDAGITVVMATDEFADVLGPLASECGAQLLRVADMTPGQVRG
jgi:acyl-CoA synthetase (AMP-forming)/AMP-acid ligase II